MHHLGVVDALEPLPAGRPSASQSARPARSASREAEHLHTDGSLPRPVQVDEHDALPLAKHEPPVGNRDGLAAAQEHGGHLLFEASVAGAIPVIKAIREGLIINDFSRTDGILNGT